ncbi:hypothetical protein SPBR_08474 [Sporothrix brasiliensis 5110]|uniref:Uncharacterized protein n=1 Tax=Sporothrix brasiliensis 5110 TaxID=1398154 RepID=A0A0C2IMR3_9PEZI|nr:uncharacterized protein SPBR_08474 [Sporothrix brasiliensis 5110]KIH86277.1 hypothetical protein SPBR_08474 [Sporothrix brasiliensis 5110]
MGGAAFATGQDALHTPRMAPAVYASVRGRCHAVLFTLFTAVATPIEGPEKADFGDIDIVVALPRPNGDVTADDDPENTFLLQEATARLGAVRTSIAKGKASMAIPWPADLLWLAPTPTYADGDVNLSGGFPSYPHIQVDLAVAPSLSLFHWALFKHAHGDFWSIASTSMLRPLGLTVDERALWLRVPEIEHKDRKRSKVFLTDEPAEVLHFLGLRILADFNGHKDGGGRDYNGGACVSLWEQPFSTAQALFNYVISSCFFYLPDLGSDSQVMGNNTHPSLLKSNDRRRIQRRSLFRQWVMEYVPALYVSGHYLPTKFNMDAVPNREAVRDAAFAFFPESQAQFELTRIRYHRENHLVAIRKAVKAAVPETLPRAHHVAVCSAMRLHLGLAVSGGETTPVTEMEAEEAAAAWTVDSVTNYIQEKWLGILEKVAPASYAKYVADQRCI